MPYIAVRESQSSTSEVDIMIHYTLEDGKVICQAIADVIMDGKVDDDFEMPFSGQFLYSITGLDRWAFRETVSCNFMNDETASPYVAMDCFPIVEAKIRPAPTFDDMGFDCYTFDPANFQTRNLMGCFGSNEREIVASWLIRWAQKRGTWEGVWEYEALNTWYNDTGGWEKRHNFQFHYLNKDTWYSNSIRREFRERPGHCVISQDDGKTYTFTPVFVERCIRNVRRKKHRD